MPVVANRHGRLLARNLRMAVLRGILLVWALVASIASVGVAWTQTGIDVAASSHLLPLDWLAQLAPQVAAGQAVRAAQSALEAAGNSPAAETATRAQYLLRMEYAQRYVSRVLKSNPMQPRLWLLRVQLLSRADPDDPRIPLSIKMIYFTSPIGDEWAHERLREGLRLPRFSDAELIELLRADLVSVLLGNDSSSQTMELFNGASKSGQVLLVRIAAEVRPDLLPLLK